MFVSLCSVSFFDVASFFVLLGLVWFDALRIGLLSHEHSGPCELLLALRGFVELVSVMVRFRSSIIQFDLACPRMFEEFLKPGSIQSHWQTFLKRIANEALQDLGPLCQPTIFEAKRHPEPLVKHIENVSLASFSCHLKGGVRDSWFWGPIY